MSLAAPIWLLLLIPWLAVLLYLMLGKPPREAVPFLWLWRGPAARRQKKPALSNLPVWITLLMLAALTAIAAAAGPQLVRDDSSLAASQAPVGITHVAVHGGQAMVKLLNESPRREAYLALAWPGGGRTEMVQLPETGERAYFLDLPANAPSLTVSIDRQSITLSRQRSWPRIEARAPLSESLRRAVDAYALSRAPGDDSAVVAIAADAASLGETPGAIFAEAPSPADGKPAVIDHAVTRDINWPEVLMGARLAAAPPEGFQPLIRVGDRTAVAVRESPRQVWIGLNSPGFSARVDYVMFWTNVFDFAGEGTDDWRPAPGTQFATPSEIPLVQKLVQNLSPWLACGSLVLVTIGLLTAGRRAQLR